MIASLGGAIVNDDGSRDYAGSGGLVGGLSFDGGNLAYWGGAGKSYNTFTPSLSLFESPVIDDRTGNDNPVIVGGGVGDTVPPVSGGTSGGASGGTSSTSTPLISYTIPGSPYRGLGAITSGGNQLISAINSIYTQFTSGNLSRVDAYTQAQRLAGYLNDPSVFYQARHGDDASALVRFRQQAYSLISRITSWIAPTTPPQDCVQAPCDGSGGGTGGSGSPTEIPVEVPPSILDFLQSLVPSARTQVDATPNLWQFTPRADSAGTGGNNTMRNLILVVAVIAVGYWLYKKYA